MDVEKQGKIFKFDLYDIFGYLILGIVLLVGTYIHERIFQTTNFMEWLTKHFPAFDPTSPGQPSVLKTTLLFLVFLLAAYMAGHIVATISSIILDKMVSERIQGLPYRRLFDEDLWFSGPERHERNLYQVIFSWLLMFVVWVTIRRNVDSVALFILKVAVVFIILKIAFSLCIRKELKNPYRYKTVDDKHYTHHRYAIWLMEELRPIKLLGLLGIVFPCASGKWVRLCRFARWIDNQIKIEKIVVVLGLPYALIQGAVLPLFRMCKPFSHAVQERFLKRFEAVFKIPPKEAKTDVFWLTYAFVCERSPVCVNLVKKWLSLYGLARNVAISFFLLFIYGVVIRVVHGPQGVRYAWWCGVTVTLAVHFGIRYYYLYYNYYSKFIFRAFYAATCTKGTSDKIVVGDSWNAGVD